MRALALPIRCLVAALLLAACASPVASAAEGGRAVPALAREWFAFLEQRRPERASPLGSARAAARVAVLDDATLAADAAWIASFRARLAAAAAANRAEDDDRRALLAWCAAESAAVAPGGRWWRDPGAVIEALDDAVSEAGTLARPGACERAGRTIARLRAVPDALRGAQVVLRVPERGATERAIARLDTTIARWRTALPTRFAACRESYRQASLIEADTLAVRAATDYLHWLRADVLPRTEPGEAPAGATPVPALRARLR